MIHDKLLEFADALSCVANTGNALLGSCNIIDLGSTPTLKDIGTGETLYWVVQVSTAIVGTTSTVQFDLCTDSTENLATSKTTHISTGAIPEATLVAGYTLAYPLPANATYERYMGIWETVGTNNLSAGAINSFLTFNPPKWAAFPDGI